MKLSTKSCLFLCLVGVFLLLENSCQRQNRGASETGQFYQALTAKRIKLPNGWSLTPAGNKSLSLNDLPLNLVVSSSGKYAAVTNNGQKTHSITLIDVATQQILDDAIVPKAYYGLTFSADEKTLYASGGNDNKILIFQLENNIDFILFFKIY